MVSLFSFDQSKGIINKYGGSTLFWSYIQIGYFGIIKLIFFWLGIKLLFLYANWLFSFILLMERRTVWFCLRDVCVVIDASYLNDINHFKLKMAGINKRWIYYWINEINECCTVLKITKIKQTLIKWRFKEVIFQLVKLRLKIL